MSDRPKVVKKTKLRSILKAAGLGAAIMYFFDPDRGTDRRHRTRDRFEATFRRLERRGTQAARRVGSQAYGAYQQATHVVPENPPLDDKSLQAKVETALYGRSDVDKGKIVVNVEDGVVILRGEVGAPELVSELPRAALEVYGVAGVQNLLHLPGEPAPNKQEAKEASATAAESVRSAGGSIA